MYSSSTEAKKNGWFSRRHKTDGAHQNAKLRRNAEARRRQDLVDAQVARTEDRKARGLTVAQYNAQFPL